MKKTLCIILSIVLSLCSVTIGFAATSIDNADNISAFVDGITKITQEYDAEKDFVVEAPEENTVIQFYSNGEETETQSDTEYDLVDFQTARLIVRADDKFDTCGAVEHVQGFQDFHILQYENVDTAISAYEFLVGSSEIVSVYPDKIVANVLQENAEQTETVEYDYDGVLCDWSLDRTQSKRLQDYLENGDIPMNDIVVGVVDSGVDYNHEFLEDRIIRTYFNTSSDGTVNDEMDSLDIECSHGTAVCSVITDNTPNNVKIKMFRVIGESGDGTVSAMVAGILEAINQEVDVINMSLGFSDESGMTKEAMSLAYDKNIPFVTALGNLGLYQIGDVATFDTNLCVGATNSNNEVLGWNNSSPYVDFVAPGEYITVATPGDTYAIWDGTSFSSPCVAALVAIMKALDSDLTVDNIDKRITNSSAEAYYVDGFKLLHEQKGTKIIQFCNTFNLPTLNTPKINLSSGIYDKSQICNITCTDTNATILYTLDGTYPTIENGIKFNESFEITKYTEITAVSYYEDTGYYSDSVCEAIRIRYLGNESDFTIDENGLITKYNGEIEDLLIPEYINGIQVTGLEANAFNNGTIMAISLPDSVTEISDGAKFKGNNSIRFISGNQVTSIGKQVFSNMEALQTIDFPNLEKLGGNAFAYTTSLTLLNFPKLTSISASTFSYAGVYELYAPNVTNVDSYAFNECGKIYKVYLPNVESLNIRGSQFCSIVAFDVDMPKLTTITAKFLYMSNITKADYPDVESIKGTSFQECSYLKYISLPKLKNIPANAFECGILTNETREYYFNDVETVEENAFGDAPTSRLEFSNLVSTADLPLTFDRNTDAKICRIALPSTFKECTEDTTGRNYKIYGTKGTYAEEWALANGHEFVEISQETALLEDLPIEYYGLDEILSPDVIGFNKTYQWYSNSIPDNINGELIEGATDKEFNPADYPQAKYYYCVVTSTDVGYEPIEIRTGVTENTTISTATILSPETSQIRFGTNSDGSFNNSFDVRTRAVITDEDFKTYIAATNDMAEQKISQAGFVYTRNSAEFSTELAQRSAKGEEIEGYVNKPVYYIQDADGYYMFACVITDIPAADKSQSISAYAYICVNGYWYFFEPQMTTDFEWLYDTYYPQAVEKYGW